MKVRDLRIAAVVSIAAVGLAVGSCSEQQSPRDWSEHAGGEWPMIEGDWGNSRFSTLDEITPSNVDQLGGAWVMEFEQGQSRATPVVYDGLMFLTAGPYVYALDPASGEVQWKYEPAIPATGLYKGVTLGEGLAFVGLSDSNVIALNQKTGELVWTHLVGDENAEESSTKAQSPTGQFISTAPAYADGVVIVPMVNGDYGVRGRVVGIDAKTGERLWTFFTIPGPGEFGHDTWSQDNDEWKKGGGGVWTTPSIDPELGLVYFGVGNPVPQWGGEARVGDNLFTESLVALDIKTGERRWHYQLVHHDIWETDIGTPPVFIEVERDGQMRKAIAVMRTTGELFMFDRATGEPVWPIEERPVPQKERVATAPTQPFPVGADQIGPRCVDPDSVPAGFELLCHFDPVDYDLPNTMYPINTTRAARMAYNPQTGHLYATASPAWPFWIRRFEDPKFFSAMGTAVPGIKTHGLIAAMDTQTNKIVWEHKMPYAIQNGSGFMATATGLLFHGEPDGSVQAFNAETGERLWHFQTGSAAEGAFMSFEADGEQYVALTASNALWTFKLNGEIGEREAPRPPPTETTWSGRIVPTAEITMAATIRDSGLGVLREAFEEYIFQPTRSRITVGENIVFTNTGHETHSAVAQDGSWRIGPIATGESRSISFDKPGTYTYICEEHPWTYGQLVVEE